MLTLGIDTSNYATSLSVYDASQNRMTFMEKRFLPVRPGEAGLRQSEAVFHHTAALPELLKELYAGIDPKLFTAVGVSEKPRPVSGSYMPCFLVGVLSAVSIGGALGIPVVRTTHQQGHIAAALFASGRDLFGSDCLVFHVSGGTTDLLRCRGTQVLATVGSSLDLYAGQAVDRLGVRLGFSFPAGEQVSRLAAEADSSPEPAVCLRGSDCCLSGLQNRCEALLAGGTSPAAVCRFCLLSVAATAAAMISRARNELGPLPCICAGGVMSSALIRQYVTERVSDTVFVPGRYSSDNAAGVALIAAREAQHG